MKIDRSHLFNIPLFYMHAVLNHQPKYQDRKQNNINKTTIISIWRN